MGQLVIALFQNAPQIKPDTTVETFLAELGLNIPTEEKRDEMREVPHPSSSSSSSSSHFILAGLHTCGDLAATMLRVFAQSSQLVGVAAVGCCYMKLTCSKEIPTPGSCLGPGPSPILGPGPGSVLDTGPGHILDIGPGHILDIGSGHILDTGPGSILDTGHGPSLGPGPGSSLDTGPSPSLGSTQPTGGQCLPHYFSLYNYIYSKYYNNNYIVL